MSTHQINFRQIFPTVIICGLLGGGFLIATSLLPIKGWWIILSYAIVLFATMFVVKARRKIEIQFLNTFVIGVLTFMIATYVLNFYIIFFEHQGIGISLWGHTWRFLMILGIGIGSSAVLGLFFRRGNQEITQA